MEKDSIIVLSGGLDSTTMLYEYKDRIRMAVSFHYGSNHNDKELACAKLHCERLGIPHLIIPLSFMADYLERSLLQGAAAIPEGHDDDVNMESTVVPFRNGIMLAVAAGLAETHHLKYVMLSNYSGDHAIYPDCRPMFVDAMSAAIEAGTYDGVRIFAPYTNITKADIARHGKELGINYAETWSCYKGGEHHCGKCGTCTEQIEALREAGIDDATIYE